MYRMVARPRSLPRRDMLVLPDCLPLGMAVAVLATVWAVERYSSATRVLDSDSASLALEPLRWPSAVGAVEYSRRSLDGCRLHLGWIHCYSQALERKLDLLAIVEGGILARFGPYSLGTVLRYARTG